MYQLAFLSIFTGIIVAKTPYTDADGLARLVYKSKIPHADRASTLLDILDLLDTKFTQDEDGSVTFPREEATSGFISYSLNNTFTDLSEQPYGHISELHHMLFNYPVDGEKSKKSARTWFEADRGREHVISRYEIRHYPYSNVVKLSTGCTGTLLTPYHVITAAHCVHDGKGFKQNIGMLKVEVPDTIGYRIHYVAKINVPVMWIRSRALPEVIKGAYDFSVLHLNLPVSGRDKFMQLAFPTRKNLNSDMQYLGFFPHRYHQLCKSSCSGRDSIVVMNGNVALTKCEASSGNSGAAVFTDNAIDGNKIIGLLSNTVATSSSVSSAITEYEAITLLTLSKCLDICLMLYPEGEKYSVCETVKRHNNEYMQLRNTRIVPFFG